MKIEFHLEGPNVCAWFATAVIGYNEARAKDIEAWEAKLTSAGNAFGDGAARSTEAGAPTPNADAPAEAEKPKRARKAKADEATSAGPQHEPAPQITTNPEDRQPVEDISEAEVVETTSVDDLFEDAAPAKVYTRDDMKDAMRAYQAKFGAEVAVKNLPSLLGHPKQSDVPEDPAAFQAVIDRINVAMKAAING